MNLDKHSVIQTKNMFNLVNPFVPNTFFFYPLKRWRKDAEGTNGLKLTIEALWHDGRLDRPFL